MMATTANGQSEDRLLEAWELVEEAIASIDSWHCTGKCDDFGNSLAPAYLGYVALQRWLLSTSTYGGFDWPRACCWAWV